MNKQQFIAAIKPELKQLGYRKKGNYWYKDGPELIKCINIQGSQWSAEDYYVNIGFALPSDDNKNPTLLNWYCQTRCVGKNGDVNLSLEDFSVECAKLFNTVQTLDQLSGFLLDHGYKVGLQYWF